MADIDISRTGRTVTASGEGGIWRAVECRNVQCAVMLHWKLTSDPAFASRWACNGDPKSPEVKRHGLEREWAGA